MEKMDKGLTVGADKMTYNEYILGMPLNLSTQIVCPIPKIWDFDEKKSFIGRP